jgi:hypothetical protein
MDGAMRFKVRRTVLEDPTLRPYANSADGPNAVQRGEDEFWYVEIPDLPALLEFTNVHGELVIGTDGIDHYIEIYDAKREGKAAVPDEE